MDIFLYTVTQTHMYMYSKLSLINSGLAYSEINVIFIISHFEALAHFLEP